MDEEDSSTTNSPKPMKLPAGLTTSTPMPHSTSSTSRIGIIEMIDDSDEDGEDGIEVIEDSDNDDGNSNLTTAKFNTDL